MSWGSGLPQAAQSPLLQQRQTCSTREGSTGPMKIEDMHLMQEGRWEGPKGLASPVQ